MDYNFDYLSKKCIINSEIVYGRRDKMTEPIEYCKLPPGTILQITTTEQTVIQVELLKGECRGNWRHIKLLKAWPGVATQDLCLYVVSPEISVRIMSQACKLSTPTMQPGDTVYLAAKGQNDTPVLILTIAAIGTTIE